MPHSPIVKLGLVQMACAADRSANWEQAERFIVEAVDQGARVICLPELFLSRYFCQEQDDRHFDLAETIPGPTTERLADLARRLEVVILAGLFERRAPGLYHNSLAVLLPDGSLGGLYRKMHIPDDPRYFEKFYFSPGDVGPSGKGGFQAIPTPHGTIGPLICWDQWFPEAARLTALQGAEMLIYPTAIGWLPEEKQEFGPAQHESWELIQRSHAIANGCFVAAVNRTGFEPTPGGTGGQGIEFWGQSFVAGPDGQILARAPAAEEAVLIVPLDLGRIEIVRRHWPFLRDRRVDAYGPLTERFGRGVERGPH